MSTYPREQEPPYSGEYSGDMEKGAKEAVTPALDPVQAATTNSLHRDLKSRHMQMIAIGGAIGAGLFVGSGAALGTGGPGSLVVCYSIIGLMLLFTMQALAELGVMFPVNGAFFTYAVRFVDRSWGFATGWDYAIQWLTVLPFEITAACITIDFWPRGASTNQAVWVTIFLVALCVIQVFGVRGYGEVEFILSILKVIGCAGFIILGIVIDCGGSPGEPHYIGAKYWHNPGAFHNGFKGFCGVFTTASFAFGGTELVGLAAAEAANPLKTIPQAVRQVFWRITFFYVVTLFIVGLIVRSDNPQLLSATSSADTKASPFVIAIELAGIKGLPSVMNSIVTISVLSVANSCTFGSTRTMQALAATGMGPKFLAYIDKQGRPIISVLIQLAFGLLAYTNAKPNTSVQLFNWLLALSGLANFFIWGTICLSHIRFRAGWKHQGHTLDELPYKAAFGVIGSYIGIFLNIVCIMAAFYSALYPVGGSPNVKAFFEQYLAAPLILALYLFWKVWSRDWKLYIGVDEMDVTSGMRMNIDELKQIAQEERSKKTLANLPLRIVRSLF